MNFVRFLYRKSKHGLFKFREEVTQKCSMKEALLKISIYREILAQEIPAQGFSTELCEFF